MKYISLIFTALVVSGCWSVQPKPPLVPPVINAKLPSYVYGRRLNWTDSNDYDAKVLFYIDYYVQYAEQNHWNATSEWYIYKLNKIETLEGQFDEEEISFLCTIGYSKPGSLMQFSPIPIQYKRRMVLQLGIKKEKGHYAIVSEQLRSWLAPYGELLEPKEEIENFDHIINSVISYLKLGDCRFSKHQEKSRRYNPGAAPDDHVSFKNIILSTAIILRNSDSAYMGTITIVEETDKYYIVEDNTKNNKSHLKIDKTTFEVSRLPVPEKY